VVIATRNYGRHIAAALESLRQQTFPHFEAVIIDDGSTDDTARVVRPFLADRRFRYHATEGRGQPGAKNLGIALGGGELVAFLDADDAWEPTKLERQVALFRQRPELELVYTGRSLMAEDGTLRPSGERPRHRGRAVDAMLESNFVCFSSVMVRRRLFERCGRFDEAIGLAIDYELWLRALPASEIDFIDGPLVRYRVGHQNLSSRILDRVVTADLILARALERRGLGGVASPRAVARARATLDQEAAILFRFSALGTALGRALRAVLLAPGHWRSWHTLGFVLLTPVTTWLRRVLRRPEAGWSAHYRRPVNDVRNQ
jgi:glycosyltransferase involved in cell wall biosynthesis